MAIALHKKGRSLIKAATKGTALSMLKKFLCRLVIVILYTMIGAAIFMKIEAPKKMQGSSASESIDTFVNETRNRLNSNLSALELRAIGKEMQDFAAKIGAKTDSERYYIWLYFSFVTIMTIGYGDITAKTNMGKIFVIIFSVFGIPLMLWLLALSGQIQTAVLRKLIKICKNLVKRARKQEITKEKISDSLTTLAAVIVLIIVHILGALHIKERTGWSLINCIYYWFCSAATIGYGDLVSQPNKISRMVPWLLAKLLALSQMAGLINTVLCFLEERRVPHLSKKTKKITAKFREKKKIEISGVCNEENFDYDLKRVSFGENFVKEGNPSGVSEVHLENYENRSTVKSSS